MTITIVLHLALLLGFILQKNVEKHAPPPAGGKLVYVAPLKGQAKAKAEPAKKQKAVKSETLKVKRLENTITIPNEKPQPLVEVLTRPTPAPVPTETMEERIARKRAERAAAQSDQQAAQPAEESEGARRDRIAKANIAAANGKTLGDDGNDTGGVFSIVNRSFHSADVKFRGWNTNFKRKWTQQVTVEQGTEIDIETAIVKRMIELIRKEKPGDFIWDSHRLGRQVPMSARVQDTAELQAFLMKEFFPAYRPPVR